MVELKVDIKGFERAAKLIAHIPGAVAKARKYAVSKALTAVRATAVDRTTEEYYVKGKEIRSSIMMQRGQDNARMIIRGKRLLISHYIMSPKAPPKRGRYNLMGAVKRAGGLKPLGDRAFLMRTRTGKKYAPMRRKGRSRLPVEPIMAPAIPQIIGDNDMTVEAMTKAAQDAMTQEFQRQAMRILGVIR